ncbi:paar motif family [Xanthomonas oryzae pv. oryzicola BLS256]|uniref:Paar motif family n=3 Tax=Xanthomonas oryzae TaxID=347 RepID=G7TAG6_XANOB|nr:paar motif family [Xanthomonas oryzae pv. oryzicola BLS256]QEO99429.1 paar motif family [Xanthomonas oryzae pv. oryzicola]
MARPSMSRAFIVEGDAHSHGGHVLAGSEHAGIDGQAGVRRASSDMPLAWTYAH